MKQDNKKIVVVGVLVMVLCAVGAFSLMGGGGSPAPGKALATTKGSAKPEDAAPKVDPAQEKINAIIRNISNYSATAARDPFAIPSNAKQALDEGPKTPPVPQAPASESRPPTRRPRPLPGGQGLEPWPPTGGQIPGNTPPPANIVPRHKVVGMLLGQKPVVVVEDSSGNQRLVPEGGQLDPTTRVTKIEKGQITVNENGKSKTLPIEEGS